MATHSSTRSSSPAIRIASTQICRSNVAVTGSSIAIATRISGNLTTTATTNVIVTSALATNEAQRV